MFAETRLSLLDVSDLAPSFPCFYTAGVRLCCNDSNVFKLLRRLEANQVLLILCGTCLDTLELRDLVDVDLDGGMTELCEAAWRADSVLNL